jgi:hypothetical protein
MKKIAHSRSFYGIINGRRGRGLGAAPEMRGAAGLRGAARDRRR